MTAGTDSPGPYRYQLLQRQQAHVYVSPCVCYSCAQKSSCTSWEQVALCRRQQAATSRRWNSNQTMRLGHFGSVRMGASSLKPSHPSTSRPMTSSLPLLNQSAGMLATDQAGSFVHHACSLQALLFNVPAICPIHDFCCLVAACRPECIHEYRLTPHSLYAAVSVGLETETICSVLERLSKTRLAPDILAFIRESTQNYGKVKLVLQRNKFFVESPLPSVCSLLAMTTLLDDQKTFCQSSIV